jgi:type VI secretion system secreted protein Hcp
MKLNNGGATAKGFEKFIELDTFDLGVSRKIDTKIGKVTDRDFGVPNIMDFIISKQLDKSSPYLFEASLAGTTLGEIKLSACGASGSANKYLEYTFSDVMLSHYSISGTENQHQDDLPYEILHLNFTKVEMKYIPRNSKNESLLPISSGYDLTTATSI